MSIKRAARPDSNFYILNKSISEDRRLSWAARGLLIYLLGKPDNWEVSIQSLVNETSDASRANGKTAVYAILKELINAGYVSRKKYASGEIDYVVCEIVVADTANPNLENPNLGFKTQTSIEVKQGLKEPNLLSTSVDDCVSVLSYLNEKAGRNFRLNSSTVASIKARMKEGATVEEMKAVIDSKILEWKGTEWEKYLRPSTLFNQSKYQGYAGMLGTTTEKQRAIEKHKMQYKGGV
jgi:uncharacterized phage protein (TIGR02220 family)